MRSEVDWRKSAGAGAASPITILKSCPPKQKWACLRRARGAPLHGVAYQSFKLLHPTRLRAARLGTSWALAPDETARGWVSSSLADGRAC